MAVAILNNSDNVTNDDLKEQFQKYSKVFDDSLTNKEIDEYWDKMLKGKNRGKKLKNIKSCFAPCWYFCLFMIQYA